eukprot:NODE_985_length_2539_cov_0.269262.p2 type:complete len:107 gc:universal NODE_985_length_2539_cov_0.269262:1250-930(-)
MPMAISKNLAKGGYVIAAKEKKDGGKLLSPLKLASGLDNSLSYNTPTLVSSHMPSAEAEADSITRNIATPQPTFAKANGISSIPDPKIVLQMLIIELNIVASPADD